MTRPNAIVDSIEFGDLAQRGEGLGPGRMLGGELLDDLGMLVRDVTFLLRVGL